MATRNPDSRGVRRLFQYAVLFALVIVVAVGVDGLLRWSFDALESWQDTDAVLARSLGYSLIGGPLAALLAWWTVRSQNRDPRERDTFLFTAYLTLTALVALIVTVVALQEAIGDALSASLNLGALARVTVWGVVWLAHWLWARRSLSERRNTPHLLLGSLVGLVTAAIGFVRLLGGSLELMSRAILPSPLAVLGSAAGTLAAGALVWCVYWAGAAIGLPRRPLWLIYVLLTGVGGGLVMALSAASAALWRVAVWFLGDPTSPSASQHFTGVWYIVAAVLLGSLLWWYHRIVLGEVGRSEVQRVYEYLVAGLALVAAAVGVGTVIVALIEAATPGTDLGMTSTNTLLAAITLLVVGAPVWWLFWGRIQRAMRSEAPAEHSSPSRRVYLVVLFGAAGVATVIAAIAAGVTFFNDAVADELGPSTLRLVRYSLGTLVAAAAVFAYHLAVYRSDRLAPAAPVRGPRSVILIGPADDDAASSLARLTGARVELWPRRGIEEGEPPVWEVAPLAELLAGHPGEDVVVIAGESGPTLMDVER